MCHCGTRQARTRGARVRSVPPQKRRDRCGAGASIPRDSRTQIRPTPLLRSATRTPHPHPPSLAAVAASRRPAEMANAASGMAVDDECKLRFLELKAKRTHRFIIYKIDEKKKMVVVEKVGEPILNYDDFAASLPANECRYAIFDYDFVTEENCQKSKIFFIAWSPDTSRVRSKMIYASSKDRFKRELDGIQVELQATDPTEVGLDVIKGRAN
ncbi:hypothetical protein GUJ93_ZPchr0005g16241 [Zizania palustris]|uniref:ADF-H domain-containing protein n=1 Tax=Zizania palustris TaxID=103762 RepID=A0A8J5W061_ZIZPA|nr:hypothetical protein GUJ93_ZPchr0005g16241 [Zizania palustris]